MSKRQTVLPKISAGDTVEVVQSCRTRVRASVLHAGAGLAEVTYRGATGRSCLAILDFRDLGPGETTQWAFQPGRRGGMPA